MKLTLIEKEIMSIKKQLQDYLIKITLGKAIVPKGMYEASQYFYCYGPIKFKNEYVDGFIIAKSTNFKWGTIITEAKNEKELDNNIQDAILTAFEIPSSYAKEVNIKKVSSEKEKKEYAIA